MADQLEMDLKACRAKLQRAHAVMSGNPDAPDPRERDAREAVQAGLRSLLAERLWIRDHAARARVDELEAATRSMRDARARLMPLLKALNHAQRELDSALRDHLPR